MKQGQIKLIQIFADIIIPLLGFLIWNWSFYFILLFFLLDYFVFNVFSFVKHQKIVKYNGSHSFFPMKELLYTLVIVYFSCLLIFMALPMIGPFDFKKDTWNFLAYEDMGIAQGYVLLPLLVYGGYAQYKLQFLIPLKFRQTSTTMNWKEHFYVLKLVLALAALFFAISVWIQFPNWVYTISLIGLIAVFKLIMEVTERKKP